MNVKVLVAAQYDKSGYRVVRVYLEPDFEQAVKDKELLQSVSDKDIQLLDSELYNENRYLKQP